MLLNTPVTWLLPAVVLEGEDGSLATDRLHDALEGGSLFCVTCDGIAVGGSSAGPASLENVCLLGEAADSLERSELCGQEDTGKRGKDTGVEVWVHVCSNDIDDRAEGAAVCLDDVEWLSGGDISVVSSCPQLALGMCDEPGKTFGGSPAIEDSLVTNDDQRDDVPIACTPGGGRLDLSICVGADTRCVNVDTNQQLQAIGTRSLSDVVQTRAVVGVSSDGSEALVLERGDVVGNLLSSLALTIAGVWSVAKRPLVAVGDRST